MKRILILSIVVFLSYTSSAQQVATYAQYMFNRLAINPAYAGKDEVLSASFLQRFQNVGLKGAPQTSTFSIHSPLVNRRVGLGMLLVHDKVGVVEQTGLNFIYAYHIPLNNNAVLSLGVQGGASWYKADYTQLVLLQNPDPAFSQNIRQTRPNFGAGVYYSNKVAYLGLSMPSMINNVFNTGGSTIHQTFSILLNGGYRFTLNQMLKLRPNFLLKMMNGGTVELDVNTNLLYKDFLWFGVSYKSSKAVVFLTQLQLNNQFRLGYSYQLTVGPLRAVDLGSHELFLNYRLNYFKQTKNPRYIPSD